MTDVIDVFLDDVKCALHRFEPKPGDVFVLTFPGEISHEQATRIWRQWKERIPYDAKVICISDGAEVELIRAGESK